jgi:gamma-glutamyltranspeptidase/glutathione hydrolase
LMIRRATILLILALSPFLAFARDLQKEPEAATGVQSKPLVTASRQMVVAANPLAAEAGRLILRRGGSAIDAAIATQLVLGLVEPQSSGLGGGAFIVYWDQATRTVTTFDGRETAPAAAKPDRFIKDGAPMDFPDAMHSGLSVGVPGVLKALELAHRKYGKLPWADLFAPAIALAEIGFEMPQRLYELLKADGRAGFAASAQSYFFNDDGTAIALGTRIQNPEYAETLKTLARDGAKALYEGPIAQAIVDAVKAAPIAASDMTLADLAGYEAKERPPVCFLYHTHKICGMGPPSSGTLTVGQILKLIAPMTTSEHGPRGRIAEMQVMVEAEKLAFADRNKYIGDPDFVHVPRGFLDDGYLAERRKLINPEASMPKPQAGLPPGVDKRTFGTDRTIERHGTSHISIVDDQGNAVSMTTTIEGAFGSHLWVKGFLLNNELTDFSFLPTDQEGVAVANAVAGSKRPRSSMAPTLVFDADGEFKGATGSPGGSRIILYVAKTLVALIDWGLDAQAAAAFMNFGSDGGPLVYEVNSPQTLDAVALKAYGQEIKSELMTSGVHTIWRRDGRLEGGADPRREGVALGD